MTEDEGQSLVKNQILSATMFENNKPDQYYKDIETTLCKSKNLDEYGIDHTEEVIIGSEQWYYLPYQDRYRSM